MSLNKLRTELKKIKKAVTKGDLKGPGESNLIKPSVVTTAGAGPAGNSAPGLLGPPKETKRALSVGSPPEVSSSPVHTVSG